MSTSYLLHIEGFANCAVNIRYGVRKTPTHEGGSSGHWYGTNFSSFGGRYGLAEEGFPFSCELMQYYDSH
ncbi:hypothetical protein JCM13210_17350 [Thermaerobacter litoralis]